MDNLFVQLVVAFIGSIPALFLTLWIERQRMPNLEIVASEDANSDNTYSVSNPHAGERWKFFRVLVKNKKFPHVFRWIPRQTAENCRAKIEFTKIGRENVHFSINGRWASTPEIPHIEIERMLKIQYPDPVTIPAGEKEHLDVITKCEGDAEAYGWNNEAYFYNWRTPHYKLERGIYNVRVTITTQNGKTFTKDFELIVADKIEDTYLK